MSRRREHQPRHVQLTIVGVAALCLLSSSCAVVASRADYADYRAVRVASDDQARMIAGRDYLSRHPDGRWAPQLQRERDGAEDGLFEAGRSTTEGLRLYLEVYPDGRFGGQARQRLAALTAVQSHRSEEQETARDVRQEQRDAIAEQRRSWGTRSVTFWSRVLMSVNEWGVPLAQVASANPEFSEAFGREPRPICSASECIKFYRMDFGIPVPGRTRIERNLRILLRLRMQNGKLERAEILMPFRGFSRWYELAHDELVQDGDPEERQAAIEWARQQVVPAIRAAAPSAHGVDVVPEPIDPPTVHMPASAESDGEGAPTDPEAGAAATPAAAADPEAGAPAEVPEGVMVLPIALQGLSTDSLRFVIFAAGDDDDGVAYDGLFIEHVQPAADE